MAVGDPPHPDRRVVGGVRRHGVDRPGLGVHDHHRATGGRRVAARVVVALRVEGLAQGQDLGGQGVVGHLLETGVDVGDQLSPATAGVVLSRAHHLALGVDLELLLARGAPQLGLVLVLEAGLAEGVAGLVALGRQGLELGAVDGAHVAEGLGRRIAHLGRAGQLELGIVALGGGSPPTPRGTRSGAL